jgi:hypothetical protein
MPAQQRVTLWAALFPTLSTGGNCIAVSTPNGTGNWFHKIYTDAVAQRNDFKDSFLPWNVHPERDQVWFDKETKNMTRREVAQELLADFLMSGETVFDPECIARIEKSTFEPMERSGFDRNLWIWNPPRPGRQYAICCDTARGDGVDFSAFHVFDLSTFEIVAEYRGKITIDLFATLIYNTGLEYNSCMVVVENNSIGIAVLNELRNLKYPNIFYSRKQSGEYMDQMEAEQSSDSIPGFTMSQKMRPIIIAKFEEYLRNKQIKIYSSRLAAELRTFIWHNGRPEAMRGYNDDLIMSAAIGCWIRETVLTVSSREMEYKRAFLASIGVSSKKLNTKIEGMTGGPRIRRKNDFWGN